MQLRRGVSGEACNPCDRESAAMSVRIEDHGADQNSSRALSSAMRKETKNRRGGPLTIVPGSDEARREGLICRREEQCGKGQGEHADGLISNRTVRLHD